MKKENDVRGVLIIDKPTGITSHDVVDQIRALYKTRAVGHGGTLDPLATGLLILLLGEATKLSQYVMAEDKSYRVGVKLGVMTDSGDITGKVVEEKPVEGVTRDKILGILKTKLTGDLELEVPKYSAVKVNGKKLYEYARKNEAVELPKKVMSIKRAELIESSEDFASNPRLTVDLDCGKGTYVRSWVESLGALLGCGATVELLRRTKSGPFEISKSYDLEKMKTWSEEELSQALMPMPEVLGGWPALKVLGRDEQLLSNGQLPNVVSGQLLALQDHLPGVRLLNHQGSLVGLVVNDPEKGMCLARVFNN